MSDILFITPTVAGDYVQEPVGTLLLATILRQKGIQADILSFCHIGDPNDLDAFTHRTLEAVRDNGAGIVSFYTRCDVFHIMLKTAELLKRQLNVTVLFGGPQSDIVAEETLQEIPYVDYICRGEGETTIYPFVSSLLNGEPDLSVPGLAYRSGNQVILNPKAPLIQDLDTLPEIDYSIIGLTRDHSSENPFPIDVGRGCPFGCTYCSTKTFWGRKYRLKSPQRIYREVKTIHEQYGIIFFVFSHDMFTLNRTAVIETCRLLQTLDFPIEWSCSARLDCIDPELIDIMVASGMRRIFIGIETGSPRMQKLINKNLKLERTAELFDYIHSKGVRMAASFIYGFPEETEEDLSYTIGLIAQLAKLKNVQFQTHLCTFLPGTEMSDKYRGQLLPTSHPSDVTGTAAVAECADLISKHPRLFEHFREYRTELRTKLEYFPLFIRVWLAMQPVYQFFAGHYAADELVRMYFAFAEDNRETLQRIKGDDYTKQLAAILKDDRLAHRFDAGELAPIIADCYRMAYTLNSDALYSTGEAAEIYCFSPLQFKRGSSLHDYKRKKSIAMYTLQPDGTIRMKST